MSDRASRRVSSPAPSSGRRSPLPPSNRPSAPPSEPPTSSGLRGAAVRGVRREQLAFTACATEAERALARLCPGTILVPGAGAPFGCQMTSTVFGPLQLLASRHRGGLRMTIPAERDRYLLVLSSAGTCRVLLGGDAIDVLPDVRGALLSPGQPVSVDVERDCQVCAMAIERGAVDSHFRALTGREPPGLITFAPALSLDSGPGATLYQVAQLLRGEIDRPDASPYWLASLRDTLLTSLLANVHHSASSVLEPPPIRVAQSSVRRAEELIHAHAGEPIALADIVAAAGVPERSLRAAFTAVLGVSPMEYLRRHRLEIARRSLLDPAPDTTVAGVVAALHLGNPGRFSSEYRRRFGESPSETLANARAAACP